MLFRHPKVTVFLGGILKSYPSDICDISSITRHVFPAVIMWSILWIWHAIAFHVLNCNNASFRQQQYFKVIWLQFSPDVIQANCLSNQYILVYLGYFLICLPRLQFWCICFTYMCTILINTDQTIKRNTADKTRSEDKGLNKTSFSHQTIFLPPENTASIS